MLDTHTQFLLPAPLYASAGSSHGVRLSQVGVLSKRMKESDWVLARELPLTYPALCCKEIRVHSKIRVLPSGTLLQTLDLEQEQFLHYEI